MVLVKDVNPDTIYDIEVDRDNECIKYYSTDGDRYAVNYYNGEVEVIDEEEDEEEEYSYAESKERKEIVENFKSILDKINNIDKRNAPTIFG